VPIVPTAVIFDLAVGEPAWPSSDDGYQAARSATTIGEMTPGFGAVGVGTGATVAKLGGTSRSGGLGYATVTRGATSVSAIVALNAVGDVIEPLSGRILAGATDVPDRSGRDIAIDGMASAGSGENTSIAVILIDAAVDRVTLQRCCISAHAALARCVVPAHTIFDGDTIFSVARTLGDVTERETLGLAAATEVAVEQAIVGLFT
jgi:L-aminopeptidase/D-esterase-like protein